MYSQTFLFLVVWVTNYSASGLRHLSVCAAALFLENAKNPSENPVTT